MTTLKERRILPNCCEDWILKYGQLHQVGALFRCLPCGHQWQRESNAGFLESQTDTLYLKTQGKGGFWHLKPAEGPEPLTSRCCSSILCEYGPRISQSIADFECPYCYTMWRIGEASVNGLRHRLFTNENTGFAFTVVEDQVASYLQPVIDPLAEASERLSS